MFIISPYQLHKMGFSCKKKPLLISHYFHFPAQICFIHLQGINVDILLVRGMPCLAKMVRLLYYHPFSARRREAPHQ